MDGDDCAAACQLAHIEAYFEALDTVYKEGSTVADIDALLALLHEDVRYVHVAYEADFDRATWRAAFMRNWERGAYANEAEQATHIVEVLHGKNHAAVAYDPGSASLAEEALLVVFRFTDGKISRIEELW